MYRSSPAKPAMNAATSSRPCIESAASWSAAIHPSVRPSSAATSAARQLQSHHLVEVRRGLVGREAQIGGADLDELATPSQPRQRQRRVGAAGDHQVYLRGQVLQQEGHPVLHVARVDDVVVVEHQHDIVRDGVEVVEQGRPGPPRSAAAGDCRSESAPAPTPGAAVSARRPGTSRTTRDRCRAGRARATPRTVRRPAAAASHSVSSVVLPNPAGADTSVSADSAPRLRRSLSLGRATRPRRRLGTWSLVSSSGPAMTTAPQEPHASSGYVITPYAEFRRRVRRAEASRG